MPLRNHNIASSHILTETHFLTSGRGLVEEVGGDLVQEVGGDLVQQGGGDLEDQLAFPLELEKE